MKRSEAFPSNFFRSEDVDFEGGGTVTLTVADATMEELKTQDGGTETKAAVRFKEDDRKLVLNQTNWMTIEEISGSEDSDDWAGTKVTLYVDEKVRFGNKFVKGLRVRAPGKSDGDINDDDMPF